jgi:hypothetical protein
VRLIPNRINTGFCHLQTGTAHGMAGSVSLISHRVRAAAGEGRRAGAWKDPGLRILRDAPGGASAPQGLRSRQQPQGRHAGMTEMDFEPDSSCTGK